MQNETKETEIYRTQTSIDQFWIRWKTQTFVANAIFTSCSTRLHLSVRISYHYEPRTHMFFMFLAFSSACPEPVLMPQPKTMNERKTRAREQTTDFHLKRRRHAQEDERISSSKFLCHRLPIESNTYTWKQHTTGKGMKCTRNEYMLDSIIFRQTFCNINKFRAAIKCEGGTRTFPASSLIFYFFVSSSILWGRACSASANK